MYSPSFSQTSEHKILYVSILDGDETFVAATLYVTNATPPRGAMTDYTGTAKLNISDQDSIITITPFNPPIELTKFQDADSIHINLKKSKIRYFNKGKRIRTFSNQ